MTTAARERARVRTPVLVVSALAWIVLLLQPTHLMLHDQPGHHHHHESMAVHPGHPSLGTIALGWAVMLAAMMLPPLAAPVRHVRDRSFVERRLRSTALFLAGYLALWMLAGAASVAALLSVLAAVGDARALALAAVAAALLWQVSPMKQACLNRLHAHPQLAAFGFAADVDAFRFGLAHGFWCVGSCWALMLVPMALPSGHLPAMVVVSLWIWGEHLDRPTPPSWRLRLPLKAVRLFFAQLRIHALG